MVRGRQALFWALMFPLMFTIIFGFFFGSGSGSVGTVVLINNSNTELAQGLDKALSESDVLKVRKGVNEQDARDLLKKNQIGAIIEVPENFGAPIPSAPKNIKVIEDPANSQVNSVVSGFINQFFIQTDYQINHIQPSFSIDVEKTNNRTLNYFDFVLMGLIGLALMNSSVQGIAITMANYREDKILKRITTTPLAPWKFVAAEVLSRLMLNVLQIGLILLIGYYGFNAHIYGNLGLLLIFSLIGGLLFQCIGFMIAAFAKTTDAAQGMSVAVTIPMMFLAGVFFPIDQLPKWLLTIVQYLPLAPLLRMVRTIGLEAGNPFSNPLNIEIVIGWIVVTLVISIWKFRLSDE